MLRVDDYEEEKGKAEEERDALVEAKSAESALNSTPWTRQKPKPMPCSRTSQRREVSDSRVGKGKVQLI
jgi:hypothetical protein